MSRAPAPPSPDHGPENRPEREPGREPGRENEFDLDPYDGTQDFVIERVSDPGERVVWVEYASLEGASPPELFERINQAQSVLAILRACLPGDRPLASLDDALVAAAEGVMAMNELAPDSDDYRKRSSETAQALRAIENTLLSRERKVPISWLRHQSDEYDFSDSSFAHYLKFQIQHLRETPECWSRIDLLITLLARQRAEDGSLALRPAEEVAALWSACLPQSDTTPQVRAAALDFFAGAAERLDAMGAPEDLFTSGHYADVLGYKLSLRRDYFDLQILYAAAALNLAVDEWLESHEDRNVRALDKLLVESHENVRKVLLRQTQPEPPPRPRVTTPDPDARTDKNKNKARGKRAQTRKLGLRKWLPAAALALALALAVPALLRFMGERKRDLEPLPAAQVQSIHPALRSASTSGHPPELLVAELDSQTWQGLGADERRAVVEDITRALEIRGIKNASIYRDRVLAIHIAGGETRFVE